MVERVEGLFVSSHRLSVGSTLGPAHPHLPAIVQRFLPHLPADGVVREPFDMFGNTLGVHLLHGVHDRGMVCSPALLEEAPVGDLVSQRVLEDVLEVGKEARFVEELGALQVGQPAAQRVLGLLGDR